MAEANGSTFVAPAAMIREGGSTHGLDGRGLEREDRTDRRETTW